MNGYLVFYKNQKHAVYANTSYEAQLIAADQLKVPAKRRHQITVVLTETSNGEVDQCVTML